MKQLVAADGTALVLKEYPRPKRVVKTFNVKIKNKNVEVVTTRGERYTYITIDGIDLYTDGLLVEGAAYKVEAVKEQVAA